MHVLSCVNIGYICFFCISKLFDLSVSFVILVQSQLLPLQMFLSQVSMTFPPLAICQLMKQVVPSRRKRSGSCD